MPGPRINKTGEHFWDFVAKTDGGCWEWQGCIDKRGRAMLAIDRKMVFAHRHAYELMHGPIPEGHELTRTCANLRCVRPDHIQAVTRSTNTQRGRKVSKAGDTFWAWTKPTATGCWEWRGYFSNAVYGRLKVNGRYMPAHRYAYELVNGPIAEGLVLDHLCRNTRCVRPDHLEPVTNQINIQRGILSYTSGLRDTCKHGHPLTPDTVARQGANARNWCRTCLRAAQRRHDAKRRTEPSV